MVAHWAVDRDTAAEQGRGLFAGKGIGNAHDEAGVGANAVGVSAVAMNAGGLHRGAQILKAAAAPFALAAGVRLPAKADALAHLERAHLRPDGGDDADDFVSRDERILADSPVV